MSKSRARGTRFETEVVEFLRAHGFPHAERRALAGARDRGDVAGVVTPHGAAVIEVKNCKELALGEWMTETEKERRNDGATLGILVVKRRNRPVADAYAVIPLAQLATLIRDDTAEGAT